MKIAILAGCGALLALCFPQLSIETVVGVATLFAIGVVIYHYIGPRNEDD
jgi:NO-binding membrane sensor protein with MHYT domain